MAVNQNVNPRPLTAEEKEKRARGIYDSFATYVVFCDHCRYVRKTNMYIMRAEAFIDELDARGEVCPRCGRGGRSATRWARRPASSSSDTYPDRLPPPPGSLFLRIFRHICTLLAAYHRKWEISFPHARMYML